MGRVKKNPHIHPTVDIPLKLDNEYIYEGDENDVNYDMGHDGRYAVGSILLSDLIKSAQDAGITDFSQVHILHLEGREYEYAPIYAEIRRPKTEDEINKELKEHEEKVENWEKNAAKRKAEKEAKKKAKQEAINALTPEQRKVLGIK